MISNKMNDALNAQIAREMNSSNLYLAMSAYCRAEGYNGFAAWLAMQAREELGHAMKFIHYLGEQNARVKIAAMDAPPFDFGSPAKVFQKTLAHEQKITASVHALVELAQKEKDYATQNMLQWFVNEQVEEEGHVLDILGKIAMLGEEPRGLYLLDRELGARKAD